MAYNTFKLLLEEETREKICVTRLCNDEKLTELFHPSQLEKRFGGQADTPLKFWPPYIGNKFIPEDNKDNLTFMSDLEYQTAL